MDPAPLLVAQEVVILEAPSGDGTPSGDANTGKYVDMVKAGINEPVKVVRTALANAAGIAGLILPTEALVTSLEKGDKEKTRVEGSVR